MIYYKNIFLNISNSFNSKRVSAEPNVYSDTDAQILARACQTMRPIVATNGKEYYYFIDQTLGADAIQYLLNINGVLAYRRYTGYQVFYGRRTSSVRVPVEYLKSHPSANAFMDKIIDAQINANNVQQIDIPQYITMVKQRMRGK